MKEMKIIINHNNKIKKRVIKLLIKKKLINRIIKK